MTAAIGSFGFLFEASLSRLEHKPSKRRAFPQQPFESSPPPPPQSPLEPAPAWVDSCKFAFNLLRKSLLNPTMAYRPPTPPPSAYALHLLPRAAPQYPFESDSALPCPIHLHAVCAFTSPFEVHASTTLCCVGQSSNQRDGLADTSNAESHTQTLNFLRVCSLLVVYS